MRMDMFMRLLIDIVLAGFGVYLLCLSVGMQRSKKPSSVLVAEEQVGKCKDVKKYVSYILPAMYIFAIVSILAGGVGAFSDFGILSGSYWKWVELAVFIAGLCFFAYRMNQGRQLYF